MSPALNFPKFDDFSVKNDDKIDNFATGTWKVALAEGHTYCERYSSDAKFRVHQTNAEIDRRFNLTCSKLEFPFMSI
jgi:hypothetical protein